MTVPHLAFWILVVCHYTWSQQGIPVHGGYSQWSFWGWCSRSCDGGTQQRYRSCTNPPPANGGQDCSVLGRAMETRRCNTYTCSVHGGYSQWSYWSLCSQSCGQGTQYRYRSCTNPRPAHRGRGCSRLGPVTESRTCNSHRCPVLYTESCHSTASGKMCTFWKSYCKISGYLQRNCVKTCGKCQVCKNSAGDSYCNKYSNYCSIGNPAFRQYCKKTCGLCRA
ncbi:mucin-like protein isoform X2 [Oculina patagonica]